MTILDALEKAKQLHAQRARTSGTEDKADTAPVRRRSRMEVAPAPVAQLAYPKLPFDSAACDRNRVLIAIGPGSEHARAADSYRILRTRLRTRLGSDPSVSLGVVSAGPDEGKSLTAVNLALAVANEKRRNVFLLDLDLRNPSICKYLGITPTVELGRYLAQAAKADDVFFTIGLDNLIVAGGAFSHDNSSELLGGSALPELMAHIRSADPNALIIVDLPPLLQSADAMVVAPHLTSTVLVIGEGVTRRDNLDRAAEILQGMPVAGVVLNRSREAIEDYYG
jgi:Mrp family chromosome partitioning ATPase